jgi:hypothetical protein
MPIRVKTLQFRNQAKAPKRDLSWIGKDDRSIDVQDDEVGNDSQGELLAAVLSEAS